MKTRLFRISLVCMILLSVLFAFTSCGEKEIGSPEDKIGEIATLLAEHDYVALEGMFSKHLPTANLAVWGERSDPFLDEMFEDLTDLGQARFEFTEVDQLYLNDTWGEKCCDPIADMADEGLFELSDVRFYEVNSYDAKDRHRDDGLVYLIAEDGEWKILLFAPQI